MSKSFLKWVRKIESYMMNHPCVYIKIEDMRVDLLAPKSPKQTTFDHAWKELVLNGRLELCGNSVRINQ